MYRIIAANNPSFRNPLYVPGVDWLRAFARLPLRIASGILFCLLVTDLAGCESKVQSANTQGPALTQPGKNPKQPVEVPVATQQAKISPKTTLTIDLPPDSTPPVTLVIEVNLATDSVDLAALQSGGQSPVPPLQLSVDLAQAPLRAVLRKLARKLDAKIYIAESVPDLRISLRLNEVSVTEGIKQILRDTNYVVIHKKPAALNKSSKDMDQVSASAIVEIRVLPKDTSEATSWESNSLKALEKADQTAEIDSWKDQALNGKTAEDRIRAIKEFLEHTDASQHDAVLLAALKDQDSDVRMLAIDSLADSTSSQFEPISQTALGDESPDVRMAGLSVLFSHYGEEAIPILEQASADPNADVQQTAQSSLEMAQRVSDLLNANSGGNSR